VQKRGSLASDSKALIMDAPGGIGLGYVVVCYSFDDMKKAVNAVLTSHSLTPF
jgi:hypothetical protein